MLLGGVVAYNDEGGGGDPREERDPREPGF
jgi:hypothetical protein